MKQIKRGRWQRQAHLAKAGLMAGVGWASGQLRTIGMPADARDEAREALLRSQAEGWVRQLGELKGSIVKVGQILATYGDYCLPAPLADAMHLLEADTEPLAWHAISPRLSESLGDRRHGLIIEPVALAAASLSQVHLAHIKQGYFPVCLKILYPGIATTVDSDLSVLSAGLRLWMSREEQTRFSDWLDAIADVLSEELDLQREAKKLHHWQYRMQDDERYVVPSVFADFCGDGVLCMSYEEGMHLQDAFVQSLSQERRNLLAASMLELFLREVLVWGEMQTDPHPGNYRICLDADGDRLVLLDFGSVRSIKPELLKPLRQMLLSAYVGDREGLLEAIFAAGLLQRDAPENVQLAFADVLAGLMEPLTYQRKLATDPDSIPPGAVDEQGRYCWAAARLPRRMAKQALQSAFSKYFHFPGADFLLLSRKLAGVYAFLAGLDARFDAGDIFEKVVSEIS